MLRWIYGVKVKVKGSVVGMYGMEGRRARRWFGDVARN